MTRKRYKAEEILGKLRQAEVLIGQGRSVGEVCREIGVTEVTYFRWRKEYGGLRLDQARKLKDLEKENARLKRAVAELTLDKQILQEASGETDLARPTPGEGGTGEGSVGCIGAAGLPGSRGRSARPSATGQRRRMTRMA